MEVVKTKKILIFSLVYYPRFIGGAEIAIKEITDRISSETIVFDMITLSGFGPRFEKIGNINVYRVGLPFLNNKKRSSKIFFLHKILFPFFALYKSIKLHNKNQYDLIWSMMASYAGFAGYLFKKINKNIPFVLSIQEGDNFEKREGLFKSLFKKIFIEADIIQVISKFLEDWSIHMGAKCPIVVIPNAVDCDLFSKHTSVDNENSLKIKLNKNLDDIFLITTSRLVVKNAVGDIIESLKFLSSNVKLLVLGNGYLEKQLKSKVSKMKFEDRVKFLGYIPHNEMPQYLHVSDIFIRPSLSEGMGNSFIEAMASGIPVIATPVGGIIDFLRDGETGLFCEVQNPKSIAQKVEKLIKDRESRDYIVKNAQKMVNEKYDWNIIAKDMKDNVFLKVL